jgi:hypothetical protein
MLTAQVLPPILGQNLLQVVDNIIKMLNAQKEAEIKSLRKAGKKEIKADDDEDEEDSDEDEGSDEDEDEDSEMEESKGEPTVDDQEETKGGDKAKTDTQESDGEDEIDDMVSYYSFS